MGRIFTIVGRENTVMVCDSKTKRATYREYEGITIGSLEAVKKVLQAIYNTPASNREDLYAVLVPNCISGLHNAETVNYWLQHRKSKKGTELTMEFLGLVADITNLKNEIGNVKILTGSRLYRGIYAQQVSNAWLTLNRIVPKAEKVTYMVR